jgi:hypothetical protein
MWVLAALFTAYSFNTAGLSRNIINIADENGTNDVTLPKGRLELSTPINELWCLTRIMGVSTDHIWCEEVCEHRS